VSSLNDQAKANADFQSHWQTWVTADDFTQIVQYGLNTVRIGVGYWMMEDLVADTEHFPQGGEKYLDRVVGYVKEHFQEHFSSS
jgi:glucan endo-1,6-beta-glucosidase